MEKKMSTYTKATFIGQVSYYVKPQTLISAQNIV